MTDGTWLALYAAMAFGAALVVTQRGLTYLPPLTGARISVPFTTVLLWALAPWFFDPRALGSPALALFAAVGLFFPVVATLLAFESNRRMGPTVAGTVSSIAPLLSIAAGVLFLGEPLTLRLVASGCAVVGVNDDAIHLNVPAQKRRQFGHGIGVLAAMICPAENLAHLPRLF